MGLGAGRWMRAGAFALATANGCGADPAPPPSVVQTVEVPLLTVGVDTTERPTKRPTKADDEESLAKSLDRCVPTLRLAADIGTAGDPLSAEYFNGLREQERGRFDTARKAYFAVISGSSPLAPYAYLAFGILFQAESAQDPAKLPFAEQSYLEVLKYPETGAADLAAFELGRVYRMEGKGEQALSSFVKAHKRIQSRSNAACARELGAAIRREMVGAYVDTGDSSKAYAFFRALLPGEEGAAKGADMVADLGTAYSAKGAFDEAQRAVAAALTAVPGGTARLCTVAARLSDRPDAKSIAALRKAIAACPK